MHGLHHRLRGKRQGLGGVLSGLFPGGSTSSAHQSATLSAASQSTANPFDPSGIIDGFTSFFGNVPTLVLPSSGSFPATTSNTPLTYPSFSSTGSTNPTPSSTPPITASTQPTPTPPPTSGSNDEVVYTSSDGTSILYITSTLPPPSQTATLHPSFLHDPSLEGGVFALVGIVVLVIAFVTVTWTIRKRRRQRLERDLAAAVTFDPGAIDHYEREENSVEKHRFSGSSSGHGHGYGYGAYASQPAYASPPHEYRSAMGYPTLAYREPSPSSLPYVTPSAPAQQSPRQGGANLTRKYSDRKPVPPLIPPEPTYDPTNSPIAVPSQYQQ